MKATTVAPLDNGVRAWTAPAESDASTIELDNGLRCVRASATLATSCCCGASTSLLPLATARPSDAVPSPRCRQPHALERGVIPLYDNSYRFLLEFLGKRTLDHDLALPTTRYLLFELSKGVESRHLIESFPSNPSRPRIADERCLLAAQNAGQKNPALTSGGIVRASNAPRGGRVRVQRPCARNCSAYLLRFSICGSVACS